MSHTPDHRLPWWRAAAYGSIAMPLATIGLPLSIYLAPFYSGELGVPLALLGTAMIVARLSDVITDPLVGAASDRWRTRWGRRRIWLPLGVAVLLVGSWRLFLPPEGADVWHFVLWVSVAYLGFTFTQLPHSAWGGELSDDYHERTRIFSIRQAFSLIGLILATALPALVLSQPGAGAGDVLAALFQVMVVLLPLCTLAVIAFTPEPPKAANETQPSLSETIRIVWRNTPYKLLVVALFLAYIAETFRITITLFYARDVIGVANIGLVYVFYFAVGLAAVPVWSWLARAIGKHRALGLALTIVLVTNVLLFFLERGQEAAFIAIFMVKGFCFGALELLPAALIADTTDIDTARSRARRQGLFFSFMTMTNKIGQAIGQGLSLILLSAIGYTASGETDPETLLGMKALYGLLPLVFLAPAVAVLWRYPFTQGRHGRLRAAIQRREARLSEAGS